MNPSTGPSGQVRSIAIASLRLKDGVVDKVLRSWSLVAWTRSVFRLSQHRRARLPRTSESYTEAAAVGFRMDRRRMAAQCIGDQRPDTQKTDCSVCMLHREREGACYAYSQRGCRRLTRCSVSCQPTSEFSLLGESRGFMRSPSDERHRPALSSVSSPWFFTPPLPTIRP